MTREKESIKKVAALLCIHQHSAVNENLISSLLTAALNENKEFMKWLCCEVAGLHSKNKPELFRATANQAMPKYFQPKKKKSNELEVKERRYERPDITIQHRSDDKHWNKTEKKFASVAKYIRAIFVEVKHTQLDGKDKNKYIQFIKHLSSKCKCEKCKFVIISSYKKSVIERLKKYDGNWKGLLECTEHPKYKKVTSHITLKEIYEKLNELNEQRHVEYPMCHMLKSYLILSLEPPDCGNTEFNVCWEDIIDYYSKVKKDYLGLKREILEWWIKELAEMNGFWEGNRVWNRNREEAKLKTWGIIKFPDNPDEEVDILEDDEGEDNERRFKVEIPGKPPILFELNLENEIGKKNTRKNIIRNMNKISRSLDELSK